MHTITNRNSEALSNLFNIDIGVKVRVHKVKRPRKRYSLSTQCVATPPPHAFPLNPDRKALFKWNAMWRNEKQAEGNFLYDCRLPASLFLCWVNTHTARMQHSLAPRARKPITMWAPYFTVWCGQKWVLWERSHIESVWENKIQHLKIRERKRVRDRCRNVASACLLSSPISLFLQVLSRSAAGYWVGVLVAWPAFFTIHPVNCDIENLWCWFWWCD